MAEPRGDDSGGDAGVVGSAAGAAPQEESSYSQALRDRLWRIRAETEAQCASAVSIRQSAEAAQQEAESNRLELMQMRARWAAEESQRRALLEDTGEIERQLALRERRCADALTKLAERDCPQSQAAADEAKPEGSEQAAGQDAAEDEQRRRRSLLAQRRERLAELESHRLALVDALKSIRDSTNGQAAMVSQLTERHDAVRKEARTSRTLTKATKEREDRSRQKADAVLASAAASQQRQRALESQVSDLHTEIQGLRDELASSSAAGGGSGSRPGSKGATAPRQSAASGEDEAAVSAANLKLQAKVASLREELHRRQASVRQMQSRLDAAAGAVAEHASQTVVSTSAEAPSGDLPGSLSAAQLVHIALAGAAS